MAKIVIKSTWHAGAGVKTKLSELGYSVVTNPFRDNDGFFGNANLELPKEIVDEYFVYEKGCAGCSGTLRLKRF